MTMFASREIPCPCCGSPFNVRFLMSTNVSEEGTDFHVRAIGFQPLHVAAQTCPACGFSGSEEEFENAKVKRRLRTFIKKKIRPLLLENLKEEERVPPWLSFDFRARIASWHGIPMREIGHLYHRAAWCCDDFGEEEQEHHYRRSAIEAFEKALKKKEIDKNELALYYYLIGENYRRVDDGERAVMWYDRAIGAAEQSPDQKWLVALSTQQKTDPKKIKWPRK